MFRGLVALALGLLAQVWSASAQDRWVLLASRDIEPSAGNTLIDLDAAEPIKQLRLVAKNGGITLSKVVVTYRDGRAHIEERRINLLAGERTKAIDPREESGFANRLTLFIDGGPKAGGVARLEVWGLVGAKRPSAVAQKTEVDSFNAQIAQLYQTGKYSEALPVAEGYVALAKSQHGEDDTRYATALAWQVKLYLKQIKYAEAEPLARRILAIREKRLGTEHLDTASSLIELAEVLRYQSKQAEATPLEQRAVEIREKSLGPKHPDTAQALNSLGGSYEDLGRFADAEALFKRALAIREEVLGPDHPDVGESLNNLAGLYYHQGRHAEAEPLYKRALSLREKALGPDHADVATSLHNNAGLYVAQGRYAEAEPLYLRAVTTYEKALGPDHPDVANTLSALACLYENQGKFAEAEALYKRSLALSEKAVGPDHLDVAATLNSLANLYREDGRFDLAEPLIKRSLAIREKSIGPDSPYVAATLSNLAALYNDQARYAEAEPLYKRYVAIYEKAMGPDSPDFASSLSNLAGFYGSQGRYAEAEPLYRRSLAVREKALGPDHPDTALSLSNLGLLYIALSRYAEAEVLLKRSLAIREKALGPDHRGTTNSVSSLAGLYHEMGMYHLAEPLYKRALATREKTLAPDHPDIAIALDNLAGLYRDQGKYSLAETLSKRALSLREKLLGPDHPDVALSLNNRAFLYVIQGRTDEAVPLYMRSLSIKEKVLGPDHPDVGTALNNLAELYVDQGRSAEAEPLHKRALAIREKALGPDHPVVGESLSNLASLFGDQGKYDLAVPLYMRSLSIKEKALGPDHPAIAASLNNLAEHYRTKGKYNLAEPLYARALAINEKVLGPDHPRVGSALNNLAALYNSQGRYAEAEPLHERALAIREKALGPDHPDVANSLNNLAALYNSQGRYAEAEPLHERALAIREKALGPDHPDVATSLNNLAALYFAQRDWARAADFLRRGTGVIVRRAERGTAAASSPGSSPGQALTGKGKSEAEQSDWYFWGLVKVAHRLASEERTPKSELAGEMFETAQWARSSEAAGSLAQMAARGATGKPELASVVRERQDLVGEWQQRDVARTSAVSQPPEKRNKQAEAANAARLVDIDARIAEIDARLAKDFPEYFALASPKPLSLPDVQAQLRDGEALILFLDTPEWKPTPEETFIWAVTKTDSRWVKSVLGTKALKERVETLRCGLDGSSWIDPEKDPDHWPEGDDADKTRKEAQAKRLARCKALVPERDTAGVAPPFNLKIAHELYAELLGPVAALIKGKHLLIVPSGALTSLPFSVLVTEEPKAAFPAKNEDYKDAAWLIRDHAITVLPSVASLAALRRDARTSQAARPFLGFGNPLLSGRDGKNLTAWDKETCPEKPELESTPAVGGPPWLKPVMLVLQRGGGVGSNLEALRRLEPLSNTADELCAIGLSRGAERSEIALGSAATETKVKALNKDNGLEKYKVVHFATHGLLASETGTEPGLVLTPPKPNEATETDDGLLTASEITELKHDADWVILSACNTAAGETPGAEALSGLARAFFYAGARALLVSHWLVNSHSAVELLKGTFKAMKAADDAHSPIGRAEALRRSINAYRLDPDQSLANNTHPASWAPFVLVGEGGL